MLPRTLSLRVLIAATLVWLVVPTPRADDTPPLSVRITSPLGRIGAHTNMRVVAQVRAATEVTLQPIRFYVDGALYKTDDDRAS
jgi:hypothetical protein